MKISMFVVVVASVLALPSTQAFSKRTVLNTYGGGVTEEFLEAYTGYCYTMTANDVTTVDQAKKKIADFAGGNNEEGITRVYSDSFSVLLEQSKFAVRHVCLGSPNYYPNTAITSKNNKLYELDHEEVVVYAMTLAAGKPLDHEEAFKAFKAQLAGESLTNEVDFRRLILLTDVGGAQHLGLFKKGYY